MLALALIVTGAVMPGLAAAGGLAPGAEGEASRARSGVAEATRGQQAAAEWIDLAEPGPRPAGFYGGFTDGRYGYLVPYNTFAANGRLVRFDPQHFSPFKSWSLDLTAVDPNLAGFRRGFVAGNYAYLGPSYSRGKVPRIDLTNFTPGGVTVLDLQAIDADLRGFSGAFTDGQYGYFVPNYTGLAFWARCPVWP